MTELELQYDASTAVSHEDADGIVATSCTVTLTAPNGSVLQSPTVTLPSLSTTCAAGTTATSLVLASVAGIARGDHLRVTTAGLDYVVEVSTVNGTTKTVGLAAGLPVTPIAADPVKSLKMMASLDAVGAAGSNYRLAWVYTDGTNHKQAGYPVAVVRWPWVSPCGPSDVREIVAELGGGVRSEAWLIDVCAKVDSKIQGRIAQTGRRPYLYLSSAVFSDVARAGIRYELAQRGLALGGQPYEAQRELRFAFDDQLATVITGLAAYDANGNGAIDAAEAIPQHFTIQGVR